jgi:hypothetical protein
VNEQPLREQLLTARVTADEKAELEELAIAAGVSLSDAMRHGARVFLFALAFEPTRPGPKPKEQMRNAA